MASKNRIKDYCADSYYHIYNRGVNKQDIFTDDEDYRVFLNLLKRYLDTQPHKDNKMREYDWLHNDLELLSYCLMPNHFHLFIFQIDPNAMTRLMRGVSTSYTTYFNKKYARIGPLFQDRYKASKIITEAYLLHISRYIHLNPPNYMDYQYSSLKYFINHNPPEWLAAQHLLDIFENDPKEYIKFVKDHSDYKSTLQAFSDELVQP